MDTITSFGPKLSTSLAQIVRFGAWEGAAAQRLSDCRTTRDLVDRLRDEDVNVRIVAARLIGEMVSELGDQRQTAIQTLAELLTDDSAGSYAYGGFQCDEDETPVRVSGEARVALNRLDSTWQPRRPR